MQLLSTPALGSFPHPRGAPERETSTRHKVDPPVSTEQLRMNTKLRLEGGRATAPGTQQAVGMAETQGLGGDTGGDSQGCLAVPIHEHPPWKGEHGSPATGIASALGARGSGDTTGLA